MRHNQIKRFLATMLTLVMTSMLITPVLAATKYETTDEKPVSKKSMPGVKAAVLDSIKAQDGQDPLYHESIKQTRNSTARNLSKSSISETWSSFDLPSRSGSKMR